MKNTVVSERYAEALFEIAKESNKIDKLKEDLILAVGTLRDYPEFRKLFYHPVINLDDKKIMFEKLFEGKVEPILVNFVKLLIDKKREALLEEICSLFIKMVNKLQSKVVAEVYTAIELADDDLKMLREHLEKYLDKKVEMETHKDETVLGGVLVKIGDRIIDGTLKTRFENMSRTLR